MTEMGLFEAKTHLSKLVEDIESGREKEIVLTRRGKPVARLCPLQAVSNLEEIGRAFETFADLRKHSNLDGITIKELIEEGRM